MMGLVLVTIAMTRIDGSMELTTSISDGHPADEIIARTREHREKSKQYPGQVPVRAWHMIAWCPITAEMAEQFEGSEK
jgi:hypothetical protein